MNIKFRKILISIFLILLSVTIFSSCNKNDEIKNDLSNTTNEENVDIEKNGSEKKTEEDKKREEQIEREKAEKERIKKEKKAEEDKKREEQIEREKAEKERIKKEKKAEEDKKREELIEREKAEKERIKKEKKAEEDRKRQEQIEREKAEKEKQISKDKSLNWHKYIDENNKERRILWLKGVKPPKMGKDGDFKKEVFQNYELYNAPYVPGNGWYDQNKSTKNLDDYRLCFAAVATNMLHYWIEQNSTNIKKYIQYLESNNYFGNIQKDTLDDIRYLINLPNSQEASILYNFFKLYFKDKDGFQSDILIDFFINGYEPNPRGGTNWEGNFNKSKKAGFFYDIFKEKIMTERFFSGDINTFSKDLYNRLSNNYAIGLEHTTASKYFTHIITVWGAEFDENNIVKAIYVTDSDDQGEENVALKRYKVVSSGNRVKITTLIDNGGNSLVEYIHTLKVDSNYWSNFFKEVE